MGKNNCCIHFCVGVVIFLQIVGGVHLFILTLVYVAKMKAYQVASIFISSKVCIASGVFLLIGVTKRKLRFVNVHIAITVVFMVTGYMGFTFRLYMVTMDPYTAIVVFSIFAGAYIFMGVMEYTVYLYYKNLKRELESVSNV